MERSFARRRTARSPRCGCIGIASRNGVGPARRADTSSKTAGTSASARIHLGTQGWNYPGWVGPFYPPGTKPPEFLPLYARAFDTVEVDSTFYGTPAEHVVRGWGEKVPVGFTFAPKLPRDLTPGTGGGAERPMQDEVDQLRRFCDVAQALGPKLGPVLIQLGPEVGPDHWSEVERFVAGLPGAAGMRWAIEFRQRGWVGPKLLELLRAHRVALALVEGGGRSFRREETIELAIRPTAEFAYVRWMGGGGGGGGGPRIDDVSAVRINRDKELSVWALALAALAARVGTVYGYFSNHFQGHSPASARMMQQLIGQKPVEPTALGPQTSLFQL